MRHNVDVGHSFNCDLWTDPPDQRWEDSTYARDELATVIEPANPTPMDSVFQPGNYIMAIVGAAACPCVPLVALCPRPQSEKHSQPSPWVNLSLWPSGGHFPFFAPTGRNMPARGRVKRGHPRTSPRVRRTRNMPALKGRNRTRWAFVPPFQGCAFVDSQPGASLAAHAASLCPRLICSAPSGQCPSLHVNRRAFRKIRSRALPKDEPDFRSVACLKAAVRRRTTVDGPPAATRCSGLTPRPLRALPVFVPQSWAGRPARWLGFFPPFSPVSIDAAVRLGLAHCAR